MIGLFGSNAATMEDPTEISLFFFFQWEKKREGRGGGGAFGGGCGSTMCVSRNKEEGRDFLDISFGMCFFSCSSGLVPEPLCQ